MPLRKGSSISLPSDGVLKDHPLKRKQPLSFDDRTTEVLGEKTDLKLSNDLTKNRLIRSNDLLTQTPTEILLDLLKQFAGIKECSDETQVHLYMVKHSCDDVTITKFVSIFNLDSFGALFAGERNARQFTWCDSWSFIWTG